jgi:hypothetical protein
MSGSIRLLTDSKIVALLLPQSITLGLSKTLC